MRRDYIILIVIVCFVFSGCIPSKKDLMNQKGFDPAYSQGYEDGVSSGKNAMGSLGANLKKDTRRFARDEQYRQGWTDGYDAGKSQERNWQRTLERGVDKN